MRARRLVRAVVAIAVVAIAVGAAGLAASIPAGAQTAATIAHCKQVGNQEVANRLGVLQALRADAANSAVLTPQHRDTLGKIVVGAGTGVAQLDTTIEHTGTYDMCRAAVLSIVTKYRVYSLLMPQTDLAIAADALSAANDVYLAQANALGAAIQAAKLNPAQSQKATQALAELRSKAAAAAAALQGQADAELALVPAGYPANASTQQRVRSNLGAARALLGGVGADYATIIGVLGLH